MEEIEACQVYAGGAAGGVACAMCRAGSTSGSWRKGWALGPSNDAWANLCNRWVVRRGLGVGRGGREGRMARGPEIVRSARWAAVRCHALARCPGGCSTRHDVRLWATHGAVSCRN